MIPQYDDPQYDDPQYEDPQYDDPQYDDPQDGGRRRLLSGLFRRLADELKDGRRGAPDRRTPDRRTAGGGVSTAEANQVLRLHNQARANVGVAPLQWSATLAASAQAKAEEMARTGNFVHSRTGVGENLYWSRGYGADAAGVDAVNSWLSEKRYYRGSINGRNGHYTQIVWRSTTRVGCGKAVAADGTVYVVCHYDPAGNVIGQRPY